MLPDCGSGNVEKQAQLFSRDYFPFFLPEGIKNLQIERRYVLTGCIARYRSQHTSRSMDMSTARAECVSAPTDIISTPVSAIPRMESRLTPPEASTRALPLILATAAHMVGTSMLSSMMISA